MTKVTRSELTIRKSHVVQVYLYFTELAVGDQ